MSTFSLIVKNTLAQGVGKLVVLGLSLTTTALLTRFLGLEGYGQYTFITAFVLFFGTLSDWGTQMITVREASQKRAQQPAIFGSVILFRALLATLAVGFLNVVVRANPAWGDFVVPTTVASFVLLALSLKTSSSMVFQSLLRFEKAAVVEIFSSVAFLGFVAITFLRGGTITNVMLAWLGATILASILAILLASRLTSIKWYVDKKVVRRVFWESIPAGALFLVFNLYNRIDILILQNFQGETAVGIYGLPYKIYDHAVLGAAFLMNSLFPLLSQKFTQEASSVVRRYYQRAFDILIVFAIFVFIVTFLLAPVAVGLLGGEAFAPSVGVLRILSVAAVVAYINHLTGYSLIAFGRQRASLAIAIAALSINVVANWIFIPRFSYTAAAVITILTEGLVLILSLVMIARTIGIYPSLFSFAKTWVTIFKRPEDVFEK